MISREADELTPRKRGIKARQGAVQTRRLAGRKHVRATPETEQSQGTRSPGSSGPVICTATVMFTDLRRFMRLAETFQHDPAGLLEILNAHLTCVVRAVTICGGHLEKFMGDGVFATFGAREPQPDHAYRAMAAAIGLIGANEALNRRHAAAWGFRLGVGVGIARGSVLVGRVGSEQRWEIGVVGDAVNVAARLVRAAAAGEVLMTGEVYREVADKLQSELTSESAVKGRSGSLEIYRMALLGGRGALA